MLKEQITEIIQNSEMHEKEWNNSILLYKNDVVNKINSLLSSSHTSKRKWIDITKKVIIENILMENDIEKYYNNVIITHNEIIIKTSSPDEIVSQWERRFLWLNEIDMFYAVTHDLLKDKFDEIADEIAESIFRQALSKQEANEYIRLNFTKIAKILYEQELNDKLDNIDPSIVSGFSQYIFREYFNKTLYLISKKIIDALWNRNEKAKKFLEFYGKKMVLRWKTVETKSIYREAKIWINSDLTKIPLNVAWIYQTINTRKNTQIPSIEKSTRIIEWYNTSIKVDQTSIAQLKNKKAMKNIEIEAFIENNKIFELYIELMSLTEKLRSIKISKEERDTINEKLSEISSQYNELYDLSEGKEKAKINNTLDKISLVRKSIERIDIKITMLKKDIEVKETLITREKEKLETTKEYDIEKQYQNIIIQLANLLLKPY